MWFLLLIPVSLDHNSKKAPQTSLLCPFVLRGHISWHKHTISASFRVNGISCRPSPHSSFISCASTAEHSHASSCACLQCTLIHITGTTGLCYFVLQKTLNIISMFKSSKSSVRAEQSSKKKQGSELGEGRGSSTC